MPVMRLSGLWHPILSVGDSRVFSAERIPGNRLTCPCSDNSHAGLRNSRVTSELPYKIAWRYLCVAVNRPSSASVLVLETAQMVDMRLVYYAGIT